MTKAKHKSKRRTKAKGLSLIVKIFIVIAIILGLAVILGGTPETAKFFQPGIQPPVVSPIAMCTGTPRDCSSYSSINDCVNLAGCAYAETSTSAFCTNLEGPAPCSSFTDEQSCQAVNCNWQKAIAPGSPQELAIS